MSGIEKKEEPPCPARVEFNVLLELWYDNHLDFEDRKIFQNFLDRESRDRGYINTIHAYNEYRVKQLQEAAR